MAQAEAARAGGDGAAQAGPAARKLAAEKGLDLAAVAGHRPQGQRHQGRRGRRPGRKALAAAEPAARRGRRSGRRQRRPRPPAPPAARSGSG